MKQINIDFIFNNLKQYKRSFGDSIYNGKINKKEAEKNQSNLFENIVSFNNKSRSK